MRALISIFILCLSTYAQGLEQKTTVDLGLGLAPSFVPELGYEFAKMRTSVELGVSLFEYANSEDNLSKIKFLRIGVGVVNTKPVILFSPLSVYLKDRVYVSPTFGFGEEPYTIFSISYQLFP